MVFGRETGNSEFIFAIPAELEGTQSSLATFSGTIWEFSELGGTRSSSTAVAGGVLAVNGNG